MFRVCSRHVILNGIQKMGKNAQPVQIGKMQMKHRETSPGEHECQSIWDRDK